MAPFRNIVCSATHVMCKSCCFASTSTRTELHTVRIIVDDTKYSLSSSLSQDKERIAVYIRGAQCINRAVDGDIVAFELLPEAEWYSQGDTSGGAAKEEVSRHHKKSRGAMEKIT